MVCLYVLAGVAQLIALSAAIPQIGSAGSQRFRTIGRLREENGPSSPDRPASGPATDRAEIAGVFRSSWMVNDDEELLIVINEFKGQELVRQNACFRTHQKETPSNLHMTICLDLSGYELIEGDLTFESYYKFNEYLEDIKENAETFLYTMAVEYKYPDSPNLNFRVYDNAWSSSPIQVSDEDFECRVTKKGKRKECMWVPKSEQFREILPYYKVGVKEMPDYSVNDTET